MLTVRAMDARDNTVETVVTVGVSAVLKLAEVPSFTVIAVGMNLHTFIASGGIGAPTYTILAGNDDGQFSLNAASGVLSLSVNAKTGEYTLTVQVMDERANTADTVVTVEVSAVLVLSAAPSFTVIASVAMSLHTFIASGGIGTPTYTILAGNEGRDFTLNAASGVLSLSMNAEAGSHTLTVQVMDARDNTVETVVTVGVSAVLALAATPSFTVIASVGMSLHMFIASGGIGTPTYTILAGNKDGHFDLDAASGVLSLSMNAELGSHTLTVQVMDERANTAQAVATVEVSAVLSLAESPSFTVIASVGMSLHTFIASGGIGTPTYTIVAGNEGRDFTLNAASGVLSLSMNAEVGRYTLTVQVMDERSNTAQAVATVGVSAALTLAAAPSFTVIASVAMSLHTFIAGGGIGRKTYTLAAGDERYFSVGADSGVLSLSMNAEAGEYTLTVRVMDEHHNSIAAVVMVGVSAVLALADAPLLRTVVGEGGNLHTFAATGGLGDKTYTIVAGNEDYFSLDPSSGVLSMEVTVSLGIYTLSVQVADAEGNVASALATVKVASLLLRDVMLYAIEGREVSLYTFEAGGGSGAKTYTIVAGNEDRHFTLAANSGVLSVQGDVSVGIYTLSMQVQDAGGDRSEALAVVAVEASLFLADAPSLGALTGITMSVHTFAASGGIGAKTYTLSAGEGQEYFTLNAASGVLSVANATVGVYTLSVKVSDSRGNQVESRGTVEVVGTLSLADAPPLEALARLSVEVTLHTFAAGGGYGAKRYAMIAGNEAGYFAIDAASGELLLPSNSAMLAGDYTLRVGVSDGLTPPQRATAMAAVRITRSGIFVLGGSDNSGNKNDVWLWSASGKVWKQETASASWDARFRHQAVAYHGRLYVLGGGQDFYKTNTFKKDVWSSADGKNWVSESTPGWLERISHQAVEYQGRLYVMGGRRKLLVAGKFYLSIGQDVWSWANGESWREDAGADWPIRYSHQAVVHNGRLYVLGGRASSTIIRNDVWSWAEGENKWSFEGNAPWEARYEHQAVSHMGRLYVLGGQAGTGGPKNDVWSSLDGKNWRQETAAAAWSGRNGHQVVSRDGRLYLMGGHSGGRKKDVWSSADGKSWSLANPANAGWSARDHHRAVVFPPNLVLSGTSQTIILTLQAGLEIYTVSAQYGGGQYTYSLPPEIEGFRIDGAGVLSADNQAQAGVYEITVRVEDEEGSHAETIINIELPVLALATVPPLTVIAGRVAHTLAASGGVGTHTYAMVPGNEVGFALDAASGVLSLSVNAKAGRHTLTLQVADARANTVQALATVEVSAVLELSEVPSFTVIASVAMSLHTFIASGGIGIKTYTLVAGDAEEYFAVDATSGVFSLSLNTPAKDYMLTVRAMDARANTVETVVTVGVSAVLVLADAPSFTVIASVGMNLHTFVASGGIGAPTYTILAGNEGKDFTLNAASGALSLSVNAKTGEYTLTVQVMDGRANTADTVVTVEVSAALVLAESPSFTVIASVGMNLHTFIASGGIGTPTYTIVSGNEGGHFDLDAASGVLSLTVDAAVGRYTLTVRVMDERDNAVQVVAMVGVSAVLSLAAAPSFTVIASVGMNLHTFIASGGIGTPTYTIVAGNEGRDFTLNAASGVLSLSVNAEVGSHTLTVQVMDERDNIAEMVVTVEVSAALVLAAAPSFTVIASVGMNLHTFIASGGIGTLTYTIVSGNEGGHFALDAASGVLSLTVDAAVGRYTLTVQVMDERDNAVQVVAMVGVSAVLELAAAPSFTVITVGMNLHTFIASGGIGTPTYTILAGNEGRDFTLNAASGVLSLSVNAELGSHTLTVQVMDERDNTAETVVTVEVAALILAAAPSFTVIASVAMSLHTFIVSGGIGLTYTIVAGNEGRDFTLNAASGVLSLLMNAEVGRHTLTVRVMDERDNAAQVVVMVGVLAVLELAAVPSFTVIASVAMSLHTFIANGGIGTPTYTIVAGNDDGNFVLNAASGVLSLSVNAELGSHTLTVQVMDARDNTDQAVATVEVSAVLELAKVPSFAVIASVAMSLHTFIASGGIGTPTYTIVAGNDDGYFVLNAASGVLSLTVDAAVGVYTLSVQVSDSRGNQVEARGTVEVVGVLSLADAPPLEALARLSVTVALHTFVTSGGYEAKRYTLIADEAGYFAIDAASGELSLPKNSAMLAGEYTLRVGVSDGLTPPQRATATAAVRIARSGIFVLGGASNSGYKNDAWWWSAGGNAWKRETASAGWPARLNHQAVAYHGRLYVMGGDSRGYLRDVWSSADGKNWVSERRPDWRKRSNNQAVEYQGRLYVLGGLGGSGGRDVWSWANGERSWRRDAEFAWPARYDYQAVVHNGRLYVLGGRDRSKSLNDVWSSADGANWRFEGNADWSGRYQLQVVSHQGRLYVLGGSNYNDVWSSLDGKSWRQEKANNNNFWNKRAGFQALSRDGLLYVLGGVGGGRKNDVWSSADGRSWTKGTDAAWEGRSFHRALVFPPNLVLSGTSETIILTVQAAVVLHTVSAQYGGGQYTYSLTPEIEGFNIVKNSNGDGVLSTDNQVQAGAYEITARVDDEEGGHAETIINIEMRFLALADAPPLFAIAGLAESVSLHAFTAIYPIGASAYNLVDDSGYFTLGGASGVLSVTANVSVGVYTLSVVVSDDSGNEVTAVATVEAVPMLSLADAPLLSVVAGKALELHTFIAAGGIKAKTYNLVDESGYFTLGASSGILSAQTFSEVGIYTVSVEVSDSAGNQATAQATVGVIARLSLADASLMAVEKKAVSLHTFAASGGIGARTYTLSAGNETGYFVLDASGGVLSLSANASAGEYTLTVEVKDERGNAVTAVAAVNISAALSLAGAPQLLFAAEGEAKNLHTFVASGGLGVKTYTLAAGAEYFTIGTASGVLSVDANAPVGIYTLSVQAADTDGNVVEAVATAQVVSLLLADVMLYAIVGREVSLHTFEAGGGGGAKTYTIVAGNEDKYFTLDANSGVLSVRGSVTVGVYTLSVEVTDAEDNRAEVLAVVAVEASLFLADAPPLTVMAGLAVSLHTFAASGGIRVKSYTITAGNEAKYFTLNAMSGVLSLRATAPEGFHTLTVQAADEYNNLAEAVATVDVSAALSLAEVPLLEAVVGMTMSVHTFAASGGIGAKTYTLVVDNGAGYFAMNATSGVLSVANATVGVYILSVKVSDSRGNHVEARATVQVLPPMSLADAPLLEALARLSVTVVLHTFVAGDGIGSKRYTLIADKSGYFALDAVSGELLLPSNSAMLAGEYILSVAVSDGLMPPQRATAAATVQIARNRIFVTGGASNGLRNDVWSSADGESWRQDTSNAGWTPRQLHQAVAHNGRLYVMGGADGGKRKDVWSSVDGANWQRETDAAWPAREIYQAVSYKGRLYVLGGLNGGKRNDVWSSADGENWVEETGSANWTARDRHQAVVHNGRIWLLGGQDSGGGRNDVWSSANGSSWRFEGNADWDARYFHQAVSHAGRLYVLGGSDGIVKNDVWSSVDGRSWVREKADNNVFWSQRYRHQSLSRDGLLYVLGGQDSGGRKKDVWSSADGRSWAKVTDAAWSARLFHQALVFPPHLVLSGSSETIILTLPAATVALHTVSAQYGGGQYTYSLPSEIEGFSIDGAGVLSADNQAQEGGYEITVRVEDEEGGHAETIININLRVLALADAPPLSVIAGAEAVSLHAFTAIYGIGAPTYDLVDDSGYFTLGDASGVLSVQANVSLGIYTVSVEVSDENGKMATAVATVEAVPMLSLADVPPLTVMAGLAVSLHTFAASDGIGVKTYTIAAGNEAGYFTLNAASGVLSLRATAPEGFHTLTVQAADEYDNLAEAVATVDVSAALSLAEAPLLEAVVGMTMSVHTFMASGGIGAKTYTLVADNGSGYFAMNATSGVLSVVNAGLGVYTLSVQVSDSRGNSVQARATVQVAEVLSLADAPPLEALARLSVMVSLHTFVAGDGIGSKRYTIIADESGYFALDAVSGELSLSSNSAMRAGAYALRVEVSDGLMPPQRATAVATVQIARNGIFVLGGNESASSTNKLTNDVWWSVDGGSWRENTSNAGWTARELHQVVAYRGRMYLMGGFEPEPRNDVWSSLDGKNWSLVTDSADWPARGGHQALVHKGRMYVLGGGGQNDVWSSADGKNWDLVTGSAGWSARGQYQAVAHNGRMYVLGGYNRRDVWSSADGSSWRFEGNAAWGPRHLHQAVSHAGRLYVLGGIQGPNNSHRRRNDVWSSLDGRIWEQEKASNNDFWTKRDRHQALSRDGLLYVLGGNGGTNAGLRKDVWSSPDGKSWSVETAAAGWGAREYHQALVFPPNLALSGTSETITLTVQAAIYTLSAQYGFGEYTYSLPTEIEGFKIDESSGVLSADNQAQGGGYEITVRVEDEEGSHAESIINIELRVLALADAPPLSVIAGAEAVSLHAFTAIYGIGVPTYNLVDDLGYFTLGDANGVLSVQANVTVGVYTVSVEVSDDSGKMATAVATVEAVPMPSLADAPPLTVMAGLALSLHTFAASDGIGVKTYTIAAGNEAKYFTLNAASGVLSLRATAPEGFHTLTVQAADEYDNLAEAVATVDVSAALSLAEASLLEAVVGMTMSVHTFAASGGIGAKTYILVADNGSGYFAINATSGVLSVVNATVGVYTLSVQVSDSRGNSVQARATVQVAEVLSLADAPSLEALARLSVMVSLHTFVASDGIGSKRYTIIADKSGYFALDAVSGELSLSSNSAMRAGAYALRVEVSDGLMPPQRATAAATVQIARNGIFVLGGNESNTANNDLQNDVWWSVDGGSWRENTSNAGWPARELHQVVAYRGRMYLLGGVVATGEESTENKNDVWSSLDGKNWSLVTDSAGWPARGGHQALVHNGRMYVLGGGGQNDVWSSADGKNWDLVTGSAGWSARGQYQAVAHNGRMYVLGGYNRRDVWSSADGSSWRFEGNAAWGPRHLHQAVSHAGRLYVLGGIQGPNNSHRRRNDVWSSLDGRIWEQEKASNNDFWTKRDRHQALSRDGLLYVLGGSVGGNANSLRKDVWSSADGKSWTEETLAAGWGAREYHQALVFPPNLALSGTSETITLTVQAAIYTLSAQYGFGQYTYSLPLESEALGFDIDKSSGVLSADNQAQGGGYEITVRVEDEEGSHAESIINIELRVLALADAPPLFAVAGAEAMSLHAFTAIYGIGAPTYNLVDDLGYFTLGDANGVLSVQANVTVGVYTVSVEVSDDSGKMATAVATVEVLPMLSLADAPLLSVVAGKALSLHTFTAAGGIKAKTYNLVDESGFFILGESSGILSVQAVSEVGIYTVSVEVSDSAGNQATAQATVGVTARLSLADASLMAVEKKAVSLHTFVASGGIGARTYTLSAGNETGYFVLDAASGVLSLSASASAGEYTLTVGVKDERDNIAAAVATVNISVGLSLADAPPLEALARLSVMVSLHTFVASDGIGSKRYTIIADKSGYFALDAVSGELSLSSNSAMRAGAYALRVEVSDGLMPPQRATAAATVQIARNGIFVLGGNESNTANNDLQNDVWWSADSENWREDTSNAGWPAREFHQVVAYRGRMYLLGGEVATGQKSTENRNDVWSSLDGKNWSLVTDSADWTARGNHQALVHNGRMYVLGGYNRNDVWSSLDGKNWSLVTGRADWPARRYFQALVHNGRMYVLGGYNRRDVWSSADGSSWRFEGDAAWGPRHLYQAVSHAGRLYVLGGIQGTNFYSRRNDVWSSLDGRSWEEEQANNNAFWAKRDRHQALSRDGLLYVLGGSVGKNANSLRKDVWSSPDGKSWSVETSAAGWEAREYHQALVFPPNLALSGSSETITLTVQAAIYTLSAQYGFGQYTYSLPPEIEGFKIDESSGVLSADGNAAVGGHTLTVRVEDEEGSQAETVVQVEIVAASTAALSAVERFAWSGSGNRNDVGLSEHGDSGRRAGLRRFQQAMRYQG